MKRLLLAALCLMPFSASAAGLNSTFTTTSATAITGGGHVVGFMFSAPGAGTIAFKDGSTGATKYTFTSQNISGTGGYIEVPEPYLEFRGDLFITLTGITDITVLFK